MTNVVHIGLGKTATTTLQKHVFPTLSNRLDYNYNDKNIWTLLRKCRFVPLSPSEEEAIRDVLRKKSNLISLESLVSWNPALWEEAADRNLKLFGKETKILITLRDPVDWMTSVYQQQVQVGNVVKPEQFFLTGEKYKSASHMASSSKLEYFCSDYVDFERLVKLYEERFDNVACVNLDDIGEMRFLHEILDVSEGFRKELSQKFKSAMAENRAYSNLAMSATFAREAFLNVFGLKSIGTSDHRFDQLELLWETEIENDLPKFPSAGILAKTLDFLGLILSKIWKNLVPTWRSFIQKFFDKLVPYKKYKLPELLPLNSEKIEKSRKFLTALSAE